MNYEKAYKEALEKATAFYETKSPDCLILESIFPELAESEDERIRKEIISIVKSYRESCITEGNHRFDNCIAWLEKQNHDGKKWIYEDVYIKEKEEIYQDGVDNVLENPQKYGLEKQGERNPTDKVEPKFNVGDWITDGEYTWKVIEVKPLDYILQSQDGNVVDATISHVDWHFHSFTIEDAKDGDVLFTTCNNINEMIFIYHGIEFDAYNCYFLYSNTKNGHKTFNAVCSVKADITPATKEQRDILFQKMKEAGYTWYAEKKELIKKQS